MPRIAAGFVRAMRPQRCTAPIKSRVTKIRGIFVANL
jgi:hypothetical protein